MADDSFTPGPWKAHYLPQHRMRVTADLGSEALGSDTICDVALWVVDYQEQVANARLIASAPDLLEALQECAAPHRLGDAKTGIEWEALAREFSRRQGIAVAAIAKATGKPE